MTAYLGNCNLKAFSQVIVILTICSFALTVSRSYAFEQSLTDPSAKGESIRAVNKVRVGQVINKTNVLKLPNYQSDIAGTVEAREKINIQRRKRAWYFISTANISTTSIEQAQQPSGWVNMLSVRFIATAKREGDLGVESLFSHVTNDSLPTASTGVRGFDEGDLKNSRADLKQLLLLNTYAVSVGAAKRFAQQGKLKTNKIKIKED